MPKKKKLEKRPKKQMEKWPILDQNHGLTLWKNVNFFSFRTSSFYRLEKPFFLLEYRKRHFPGLYCLKKNGKMANFGPKLCVNPYGKISVFRLLELFVL